MLRTARGAHPGQFVAGGHYTSGRSINRIARHCGLLQEHLGSTALRRVLSSSLRRRELCLTCPTPATNGRVGCGVQAAASVAKFAACYLALPVVPDGMIMPVTCLSLGSISRTSLFASLVYSYSLATET
jgi:hypothetical protein